jgi:hypothetical protein
VNAPASSASKTLFNQLRWLLLTGVIASFLLAAQPASAAPYAVGDVFAGIGNGKIKQFAPNGTLKDTLNTTGGNTYDTGMCFDAAGNLYSTNFDASNMTKFNNAGAVSLFPFGSGFNAAPESCVRDASGNIYVGQADGTADILKFNSAGSPLDSFDPAQEGRGTDWIDLASDQCTMYYTSEGSSVKRFDVCTDTQLADFATGLPAPCFALRIRPNDEVLVACASAVVRLSPTGTVIDTYPASDYASSFLFALNLDPDGQTFWTGDISSGLITRINIATGNQVIQFSSQQEVELDGLAVFGELTQGATLGRISARGTVATVQGPTIGFSAANNCDPPQSTQPSIVGTTTGAVIWTKNAVTQSTCTDQPPASPLDFDTQTGTATGNFGPSAPGGRNGQTGTLAWTYHDGAPDTVQFTLRDNSNAVVYQANQQTASAYRGSPGGVWTFGP